VSDEERSLIAKGRGSAERAQTPDAAWYRRMLRSPEAWLLSGSEFCFGIAGFVFATWYYTYLVQVRGAGAVHGALLAAMPYLAIAIGSPLGGFLSDRGVLALGARWGRRIVPLISIMLSGIALAIAPLIHGSSASCIFLYAPI
jgi:ACS family glucarate transporter-like MFS transporter